MKALIALTLVAALSALTAATARPAATGSKATLTAADSRYGRVLFDGKGRALYAFTRDRRGGKSRCYGDCARAWPVYYKPGKLAAGRGVRRSLVGTVRRADGRLQVTYNGWPLYYYVGDKRPRQISCQDVTEFGGTWLVVSPSGRLVR
jgi:predicted lipoprotein with Yx(FWY)xxD motif